jgi:hypothetical protein
VLPNLLETTANAVDPPGRQEHHHWSGAARGPAGTIQGSDIVNLGIVRASRSPPLTPDGLAFALGVPGRHQLSGFHKDRRRGSRSDEGCTLVLWGRLSQLGANVEMTPRAASTVRWYGPPSADRQSDSRRFGTLLATLSTSTRDARSRSWFPLQLPVGLTT